MSLCFCSNQREIAGWLQRRGLSDIPLSFCESYDAKWPLAKALRVEVMVDDKMQVLQTFPSSVVCIWFCAEPKRIVGAYKYQPEFVARVKIARDWNELVALVDRGAT